jgi:DNA-binding response OmpR family regulator
MPETKRTIIIVDDDRSILRVFMRVLEKKNYAVFHYGKWQSRFGTDRINRFDAARIDVRLPDMEGTAILRESKKHLLKR